MRAIGVRIALLLCVLVPACSKDDASARKAAHDSAHQQDTPRPPAVASKPRPRPPQLTQVTLKALGMYCEESCPLKVRTALADIPAVYELGFDVSTESIFVSYDATLGTPKDVTRPMLVAIKSAGFDPWLAKESWPDTARAAVQVVATN
ncbi:MAG: hypothetical protein JWP01_873 [Myxococcales bacterium]|nr:hypothetical protein [Myxococcales bacterium]